MSHHVFFSNLLKTAHSFNSACENPALSLGLCLHANLKIKIKAMSMRGIKDSYRFLDMEVNQGALKYVMACHYQQKLICACFVDSFPSHS